MKNKRNLFLGLVLVGCDPRSLNLGDFDAAASVDVALTVDAIASRDASASVDQTVIIDASAADVARLVDAVPAVDVPTSYPDVPVVTDVQIAAHDVPAAVDLGPSPYPFGDLLRGTTGTTISYYASDRQRYVFPNTITFTSWYADFSGVQTILDADLAAIRVGGNVTIRPGTWLGKITTDPKVYAITRCGVLHWLQTESVALGLFGPNWNTGIANTVPGPGVRRTQDIPDAFLTNYTVGLPITSMIHPDGTLIRYTGHSERYVVMGGLRRPISTDAFIANRFQEGFVIETAINYPMGTPVTGYEAALSDTVCTAP